MSRREILEVFVLSGRPDCRRLMSVRSAAGVDLLAGTTSDGLAGALTASVAGISPWPVTTRAFAPARSGPRPDMSRGLIPRVFVLSRGPRWRRLMSVRSASGADLPAGTTSDGLPVAPTLPDAPVNGPKT